jgi:hypothetical protein
VRPAVPLDRSQAEFVAIRFKLVCSPRLLEADVKTVEQMQLVNALCRLVELAVDR